MAEVYIKNMRMPECCCWVDQTNRLHTCPILDRDCYCKIECTWVGPYNKTLDAVPRPNWCPLCELSNHGDLIDRDLLEEDGEWDEYEDGYVGYSRAQINNAKAIIPRRK